MGTETFMRRTLYLAGSGLALGSLALAAFMMRGSTDRATPAEIEPPPAALGAYLPVAPVPRARSRFVGVILARESVDVASELDGRLESVLVKIGVAVKKNEILATLDRTPLSQELMIMQASLHARQAELSKAELNLGEARRRMARVAALGAVVSDQDRATTEVEEKLAVAALEAGRARVDEELARIHQLQERLSNAEIRAPFPGTVAARYQDPGALLQAGTPIVRLIRSDDLWVRFAVPEDDLNQISLGGAVVVEIESHKTNVWGVVEQIAPEVDAASQMVVVEARLKVPEGWKERIQSGLMGRVSTSERADSARPRSSVLP